MQFRTHVKPELRGISGQDEYADGMVEHDMHVGKLLDLLDELGVADNTIVFYSTDNGPHMNTWPDAGWNPFHGEKNTNWEGGWRVPAIVRWPGRIKAGSVSNQILHHMDWLPTFLAAAGEPDIKEKLLTGYKDKAMGRDYKVHLDLQYPAAADWRDRGKPAQGDLLLLRRRRSDRAALRRLITRGMFTAKRASAWRCRREIEPLAEKRASAQMPKKMYFSRQKDLPFVPRSRALEMECSAKRASRKPAEQARGWVQSAFARGRVGGTTAIQPGESETCTR